MALWSTSCAGGGTTAAVPVSTAGFSVSFSATVTFGNQPVGIASTSQSATVTNTGTATLTFSYQVEGANAGDYTPGGNCGTSLAPSAQCTLSVTFTPSAVGIRTASVVFTGNFAAATQIVNLTGTGVAPEVGLSTTGLTFGSQLVGTSSPPQTVTLTNSGSAPLSITSTLLTGTNSSYFPIQTNSCPVSPSTLAANGICTITVAFNPTSAGTFTAAVTITDNNNETPNSTQTVSLTGTGGAPSASLSTPSAPPPPFGPQGVGTTSSPAAILLSNTGNATLNIASIGFAGTNAADFAVANTTCGSTLGPSPATCTISVTFTPLGAGPRVGTLVVTDNSNNVPNSMQTVTLTGANTTGTGNAAVASLSPTTLAFGSQTLGVASSALTATLSNTGNITMTTAVTETGTSAGDFSESDNCGSVAAGANCTISVTFKPTVTPPTLEMALLTLTGNASNSPQTLSLSGTGTASLVSFSVPSLNFGNQNVSTTSTPPLSIVLTNEGGAPLIINSIVPTGANSGEFNVTTGANACPSTGTTVASGLGCTIYVTFTPNATGSQMAAVTVTDNSNGVNNAQQSVSMTGTGVGAVVQFSPTSLSFGAQPLSTPSAVQIVTLTNTGNSPLMINSFTPAGPNSSEFSLGTGTTCSVGVPVAAGGGTCNIGVTFTPTTTAAVTGTGTGTGTTVPIADNATNIPSPQYIPLSGSGSGPVVGPLPSSLTFGSVAVGTPTPPSLPLTITNTGNMPLNITAAQLGGANPGDYSVTLGICVNPVAAGSSCTMNVTFAPTAPGSNLMATLTITDNAATSPPPVTLTGTGTAPLATPSSLTLNFPTAQNVGTTSGPQTISLSNTGNASLSISSIALSSPSDFALASGAGQCVYSGGTLGAGASCTIYVTFTPTAPGARTASLAITDNNNNMASSLQTVSVSGMGAGPQATFSTTSYTFSSQSQGTTSSAQPITLTNTGNANLTVSGITLVGTNPTDFGLTSGTSACTYTGTSTLAAGSMCTIYVTFTPATTASYTASISVADNAPGTPQAVSLAGSGVQGIVFTPTSLSFPNTNTGATSAPQTVTVTNNGSSNFTINSVTNSDTTDFSLISTSCTNATLTPNVGNCVVTVKFTPQSPGLLSGTLSVADTLTGSPQIVTMSGTGQGPTAIPSPTSYAFASQSVSTPPTPSSVQAVSTLANNGNTSLTITSIVSSDTTQFPLSSSGSNPCPYGGGTLGAGLSCTIYATFAPTTYGTRTALVTVTDNALNVPNSTQSVSLRGIGNAPFASITSPVSGSLTFSSQPLGTPITQNVTLTNQGNVALTVSGPTSSDTTDFPTPQCGSSSVAANGGTCTVTVTFMPATPGPLSATLTFTDNSNNVANSTQPVMLSGTGSGPVAVPSPSPLQFGNVTISTPTTLQLTVSNLTGNLPLTISSVSAPTGTNAADFTVSFAGSTCATSSVPVGSSCTFGVTFTPTSTPATTENASITINDNAYPATQTVNLIGTGTGSAVNLSPSPLAFPAQAVTTPTATPGAAMTLTLKVIGNPITMTSIQVNGGSNPGDFNVVSGGSCSAGSQVTTSCTISVTFAPTASGSRSAVLSVPYTNSSGGGTASATLTGTGTVGTAGLSPTTLMFGNQAVPSPTAAQTVTLTNGGSSTLNITNIGISGDFAIPPATNMCAGASPLAVNGNCTVGVTFTPPTAGNLTGSLTFTDSATNSPQTVNLSGTGTAPETVSPASLTFTSQPITIPSTAQAITITNTGNATLTINSIALASASITYPNPLDFVVNNGCSSGSVPGNNGTCTVTVTFMPTDFLCPSSPYCTLTRNSALIFTDNNNNVPGSTQTVPLTGTAAHDVVLTWTASPTAGVVGYDIFRGISSGGETLYATDVATGCAPSTTCTYLDTGVASGTTYYYKVTAIASNGTTQSAPSTESNAALVPAP